MIIDLDRDFGHLKVCIRCEQLFKERNDINVIFYPNGTKLRFCNNCIDYAEEEAVEDAIL